MREYLVHEIIGKVFNELNRVGAKYDAGGYDLANEHHLMQVHTTIITSPPNHPAPHWLIQLFNNRE